MKSEILPFSREMIPEAAELLAARHMRNRKILPTLPLQFERADVVVGAIEDVFGRENIVGYMVMRNHKMKAYLLGTTSTQAWGRCGWVNLPCSGLAVGESPAIMQDLYAQLGEYWVNHGAFIHHIYFSKADEELLQAWFDLGFGKERIDAILNMKTIEIPPIHIPNGIEIRRAKPGDKEHLESLSHIIYKELEKPPYWHPTPPEMWEELRKGWGELADDRNVNVWLAMYGDRALGTITTWEERESSTDMLIGPKTFTLSIAATRPECRGRGIATALTWTCLAHGREQGFDYCHSDWISPNLAASRFWPRFGFTEVAYRLTKQINPMIAWTRNI